nr:TPM domain-containing protein [uncultured Allomuricauda sp.]
MNATIKISIVLFYIISNTHTSICFAQNIESINKVENIKPTKNSTDVHIYDYEKIFTDEEITILSEIISKYKELTKNEILVATTHSIGNFSNIQEYATYLGSTYSNDVKNENVVTIVLSKKLKKIAIATSPIAQENLTDEISSEIIKKVIIPRIMEGDFFDGIKQGIYDIMKILNKE